MSRLKEEKKCCSSPSGGIVTRDDRSYVFKNKSTLNELEKPQLGQRGAQLKPLSRERMFPPSRSNATKSCKNNSRKHVFT